MGEGGGGEKECVFVYVFNCLFVCRCVYLFVCVFAVGDSLFMRVFSCWCFIFASWTYKILISFITL